MASLCISNPNVLQIALLKKILIPIQGLTQRVMKPYMYSGATITYLGLSNDWNELDDEEKEVCGTIFIEIIAVVIVSIVVELQRTEQIGGGRHLVI